MDGQSAKADPQGGRDTADDKMRELELKLEIDPGGDQVLLHHPLLSGHVGPAQQTVSVYYDTKKQRLRDAGITLRVREADDRFVQTVKADRAGSAGLFDRAEWEAPLSGPDPDLERMATGLEPLACPELADELRPVYRTLVDRRAATIDRNGTRIELVLDRGEVVAGDRRQPLLELELELIEGAPAALFEVARELQTQVPLRLGVLTKSERGERLASGKSMRAMKAEPVRLTPEMTAAQAFQVIAFACLRHFRANEPLVVAARDADALHQSRVALRRLRSAFSLFRPILKGLAFERFKEELRALSMTLGRARNLDVLLDRRTEQLSKLSRERLVEERGRAYETAIAALRSPCTAAAMLDLAEWIALGERSRTKAASRSAAEHADRVLDRFWKKVKKPGRKLRELDDADRHQLRIAGKKLRYAGEFFAALYAGEAHRSDRDDFLTELEALQDGLGGLNDLATEQELETELAALGIALPPVSDKQLRSTRRKLLRDSSEAAERLEQVGPYWRG